MMKARPKVDAILLIFSCLDEDKKGTHFIALDDLQYEDQSYHSMNDRIWTYIEVKKL